MRRFEPAASACLGHLLRSSATLWGAAPNPAFATWQPPGMIKPSPAAARSVGSLRAVKRLSRHKRAANNAAHLFHDPLDSASLPRARISTATANSFPLNSPQRDVGTSAQARHCKTQSPETNPAKTAAQRQAAYRAHRPHAGEDGNGGRPLNLWVSTRTDLAIERLARRHCVPKREIVEHLVIVMDDRIIATLDIDAPEWDQCFTAASVTQ